MEGRRISSKRRDVMEDGAKDGESLGHIRAVS
jgi:hypothetical protein